MKRLIYPLAKLNGEPIIRDVFNKRLFPSQGTQVLDAHITSNTFSYHKQYIFVSQAIHFRITSVYQAALYSYAWRGCQSV